MKKYLLIQSENTLSYDDSDCFINDKPCEKKAEDNRTSEEICLEKQKAFYETFLKRHFKNVVVLAAAGTSMDNGDGGKEGKTRSGLWEHCLTEIDAFADIITDLKTKSFYKEKDIEGLLSYLILYEKLNGEIKKGEEIIRKALENKIAEACNLELQPQAPHQIAQRQQYYCQQVITTLLLILQTILCWVAVHQA